MSALPHDSLAGIDPLQPLSDGRYRGAAISVLPAAAAPPSAANHLTSSTHFDVWRTRGRVVVRHHLPASLIDDALATLLDCELFGPGWLTGQLAFEEVFTGVVLTSGSDPLQAWELFYRNTLHRFAAERRSPSRQVAGVDAIVDFAAIHARADELTPAEGSVLELGACFGFLSLLLADAPGRQVIASDVSASAMRLLGVVAAQLGRQLRTTALDATRIALPARSVDTVLLIHLLEHLDTGSGRAALAEATRVAARRVIVAVPYEEVANPAYGHVRTFESHDLAHWGQDSGWSWAVHDHRGGWLVLDRP